MANSETKSVFILMIDGVPVEHAPAGNSAAKTLMRSLLERAGGFITCDPGGGWGETKIDDVAEALSWTDLHAGSYQFIGEVRNAGGAIIEPSILISQWYAYEFPESKGAIEEYCRANGLAAPDECGGE